MMRTAVFSTAPIFGGRLRCFGAAAGGRIVLYPAADFRVVKALQDEF
jgi:hypothetical protein